MANSNKENLYGWVFVFNPYQDVWMAAKRENYIQLFSGAEKTSDDVLKSKNIMTLVELISRTDGDTIKIDKLLKTKKVR
jgi:hypothetical protein